MHPDDYFVAEDAKMKSSKHQRWIDVEEIEVARLEVGLIRDKVRCINQGFVPLIPSKTLESIQGKRKAAN